MIKNNTATPHKKSTLSFQVCSIVVVDPLMSGIVSGPDLSFKSRLWEAYCTYQFILFYIHDLTLFYMGLLTLLDPLIHKHCGNNSWVI